MHAARNRLFAHNLAQEFVPTHASGFYDPERELWVDDQGGPLATTQQTYKVSVDRKTGKETDSGPDSRVDC